MIPAENKSKSSKSNSPKLSYIQNFGHLNQSKNRYIGNYLSYVYTRGPYWLEK